MEMVTAPRMFVSWPNYILEFIEKVLLGFSAFRTLSHGGAIGRFELLDDDAKKTFLEHFALRADGTGGATGATSSSDASQQTEAVLSVTKHTCLWNWFAATLLVIRELDRVEVWVNLARRGGSRNPEARTTTTDDDDGRRGD